MDFRTTSLTDLADSVRARTISARELTDDGSRPHRHPQPPLQRIRRHRSGTGTGGRRRIGRGHSQGRQSRTTGRHPACGQGQPRCCGLPHHPRRTGAGRCAGGDGRQPIRRPPAGRRVRHRRQDQHARVRILVQHDECHVRPDGQPVQHRARARRVVGRIRSGARSGHGAPWPRDRTAAARYASRRRAAASRE